MGNVAIGNVPLSAYVDVMPTQPAEEAGDPLNANEASKNAGISVSPSPSSSPPELVIGLICALGTNTERVCDVVVEFLERVSYKTEIIHLIEELRGFERWYNVIDHPRNARYEALMNAGNEFRRLMRANDALALLGVDRIRRSRSIATGTRMAYLIRSLKTPEEVTTLRKVYGRNFIAIGTFSSEKDRANKLASDIAASKGTNVANELDTASKLLHRDQADEDQEFGQNVLEAYPLADFFVRSADINLENEVKRVIELFFGNFRHTTTRDEYGMFHAFGASLRSSSLGRQVGAAICENGEVLALGCNDVPHAFGGLSWAEDSDDNRDHALGYDTNDKTKRRMVRDLLERLNKNGWLVERYDKLPGENLVQLASDGINAPLRDALVNDVIDYGRAVHAEMDAITSAAKRGVRLGSSTLYTTTFPCHNCVKHILAVGIRRVIFIEPYPKSYALDLYRDEINIDSSSPGSSGVPFDSFVGIAPRQYARLYLMGETARKNQGVVLRWKRATALPRDYEALNTYIPREEECNNRLHSQLKATGLEVSK